MSTFTWVPDRDPNRSVKADVNKAAFGDGYSQRAAMGLNSITEKIDVTFTGRTRVEVDQIDNFLTAQKGVTAFEFTLPGKPMKKYTCDTWNVSYGHDQDCSISCTFEQVFEL